MVKNPPADTGNWGSIPGSGRSPGEGNDNPLQYSCLGNPTDRGALQATILVDARVRHDLVTKEQQYKEVFHIPNHQGREHQNHKEMSLNTFKDGYQREETVHAGGETVEERDPCTLLVGL